MRRRERAVADPEVLARFLEAGQVAHIAFLCRGKPAVVPLSYGWERHGGRFFLYFHGAVAGRKIDAWRENPEVAFEVVASSVIRLAEPSCRTTCCYESVMGEGGIAFLESVEEKRHGLALLMSHCAAAMPFDFPEAMLERTAVFRLAVTSITGKTNLT